MKGLLATVCFITLAGSAAAFELQGVSASDIRAAEGPAAPAVKLTPGPVREEAYPDWQELRSAFFRAEVPADLAGLVGVYQGHLHPLYEREDYTVPVTMAIYADYVTGSVKAAFPMPPDGVFETIELKLTPAGAEFADAWGGRARLVIRKAGADLHLMSNLYSDETYGVVKPALKAAPAAVPPAPAAARQAYTGALPSGDLFGPLPPYFCGEVLPLQVNGQPVNGIYEYSNKVIFYQDKAAAITAAENAAAAIRAAGGEVIAFKAGELDGRYFTSVAFIGKRAVMYRWDDDASSAEEAGAIVKRKTERYRAEGYSILETSINKADGTYHFFIICARFY